MPTRRRIIIYQIFKMTIFGAFLFGCVEPIATPSPDQMDKSPFTGIPCAAPCWNGLEVGKSSESDVMSTMPTLGFINQDTVDVYQVLSMPSIDPDIWSRGVKVIANCIQPNKQCLTISIVNDILTEIVITLNYELEMKEAIEQLGNPDYVGFDRAGGELVACRVYLIWNEKQLVLASKIFEGPNAAEKNCFIIRDTGKVSLNILVSEAKYLSIPAIEELLLSSASEFFEFTGTIP